MLYHIMSNERQLMNTVLVLMAPFHRLHFAQADTDDDPAGTKGVLYERQEGVSSSARGLQSSLFSREASHAAGSEPSQFVREDVGRSYAFGAGNVNRHEIASQLRLDRRIESPDRVFDTSGCWVSDAAS